MTTEPSPDRPLGMRHVAAVVIGAIIGVGIFFTPSSLARALPSPTWVVGVWLLGGLASVAGALVFAELGARFPKAGGIYVFLREGFPEPIGGAAAFLYGWIQLLVVQPGSMAVIAIILMDNVGYLTHPLPPLLHTGGAVFVVAVFTGANLLGLRTGGKIQLAMAGVKLGALAVLIVIGIVFGTGEKLTAKPPLVPEGSYATWLVLGLIPVLFSFGGAYHGTFIAGSVRDPERSVPRGIALGIGVVLVGYLAVNLAYLGLLGQPTLAASKSPAADAAALAMGNFAGKALAGVIVISAAGILNTISLGFPFVIYAMARDGVFPKQAGKLDPRTGRPALAVALQGLWACLAVLVASRVDALLTGMAFVDAAFQAAVGVVHLRLRGTPAPERGLRAPLVAVVVFLLVSIGIAIGTLVEKPMESTYGAIVLVVGVVVFLIWRKVR